MRNDYTDYIAHGNFHKYVAKVKTAVGNKYFYTQDEYNAFLRGGKAKVSSAVNTAMNGRQAGIHQTPTRGVNGATYSVKKKVSGTINGAKSKLSAARDAKNKTTRELVNGRPAGIHQTPTRGLSGAAYTAKRGITATTAAAKNKMVGAAATVGSTKVTNAKNGPQAPASVYANHKKNQANMRYDAAANKVKGAVNNAKTAINNATTKVKNRVAFEKHVFGNKINALEYKVGKKVDGLLAKNKKISSELASKMKNSVEKLRSKVAGSGGTSEEIKMMNDKLDRIMKQIEQNQEKPLKNTGSHPAYNQGVVSYGEYKPSHGSRYTNNQGIAGTRGNKAMQGSRPTDNQGYVSKKDRKKAAKAAKR